MFLKSTCSASPALSLSHTNISLLFYLLSWCLLCISPFWHMDRTIDIFTHLFYSPFFNLPLVFLPHLIQMHGCIFGLCRDSTAPGGFSWNQFTLPLPSHWSTIYRPSTSGAAGRPFNRYIRCLTWQSSYSSYINPCFKHQRFNISGLTLILDNAQVSIEHRLPSSLWTYHPQKYFPSSLYGYMETCMQDERLHYIFYCFPVVGCAK